MLKASGKQNNGPKHVHVLILKTYDLHHYITWQKIMKVKDGIKVANRFPLKWGDYIGLSGLP